MSNPEQDFKIRAGSISELMHTYKKVLLQNTGCGREVWGCKKIQAPDLEFLSKSIIRIKIQSNQRSIQWELKVDKS
jgi:hypothetical protein